MKPGDVVVYFRDPDAGINSALEIGVVKRVTDDGAFVAYHVGDTCSKTPFKNLAKVGNGVALKGLSQRIEQLGQEQWGLPEDCEVW